MKYHNSITAAQQHSITAELQHSITAAQQHSITAAQQHSITKVFITGGTGFVGRHLVRTLLREGYELTCLLHSKKKEMQEGIKFVSGDILDKNSLIEGMKKCDAVIHLVGIIHESGKNTFKRIHSEGTKNVVESAKEFGIKIFLHMSALGTRKDAKSKYHRTKYEGEEFVRNSGIPYCIFRPSVILGKGDGFTREIKKLFLNPFFIPVIGNGLYELQPVYIDDIVACFSYALKNPSVWNKTFSLAGKERLQFIKILDIISMKLKKKRIYFHIPESLATFGAFLMEKVMSSPLLTTDQLKMLKEGSTCDIEEMKSVLNIEPLGFQEIMERISI